MKLEKSEKVLLAVGLFMCAFIIGYNAFFVPEAGPTTIVQSDNKFNDENSDVNKSDIDNKTSNEENKEISEDANNKIVPKDEQTLPSKDNKPIYSNKLININLAGEEEMSESLKGIGPAMAKRIVDYRNKNGGFSNIEEIKNVKGIGEKIFSQIKDNITVKS